MTKTVILATPHTRHDALEHALREAHGLNVVRLREKEELTAERVAAVRPDFVFFPHWSWIIPAKIHEQYNCVIFHMTDVPFGRGGSPLQNLIVRKIYETKLSAIKCVSSLDAGPVYLKMPLFLDGSAEEIFAHASNLMEKMIVRIVNENIVPIEQKGDPVIFERRKPEDGNLEQAKDLTLVYDMIRMLDADGYPSAFLTVNGLRFEFTKAQRTGAGVTAQVKVSLDEKKESA